MVIASSTRGFAVPEADTPPVISPYAGPLQDQDEKRSLSTGALPPSTPECSLQPSPRSSRSSQNPLARSNGHCRACSTASSPHPSGPHAQRVRWSKQTVHICTEVRERQTMSFGEPDRHASLSTTSHLGHDRLLREDSPRPSRDRSSAALTTASGSPTCITASSPVGVGGECRGWACLPLRRWCQPRDSPETSICHDG